MQFAFAALTGWVLAYSADAMKSNSHGHSALDAVTEPWCDFNIFPSPTASFDARGVSTFGDVLSGGNLTDLRQALAATQVWALNRKWQFKAKVSSGYTTPLQFGFPGGDGFFSFKVSASASDQIIDISGGVKCEAGDVSLEYRGTTPGVLSTHSVIFSDICFRQMPCSKFEGCVPSYHYKVKANTSGDTFDQCCEPVYCKDTVSCAPSSQWEQEPDFATRMGNTLQACCQPKLCPENICNSTKYVAKAGTGELGSTEYECCNPRYCADYQGCSAGLDEAKLPDKNTDGTPRLGSTDEECCNVVPCSEFNCTTGDGLWTTPAEPAGHGHSAAQCCEPLFCANFSCATTKSTDKANPPVQGNSTERCCEPLFCSNYNCSTDTKVKMTSAKTRLGSTDDECCEPKLCKDYKCSDTTKYVKKPLDVEVDGVGHISRIGFTDEECCSPVYCRAFSCTSSKWKSRNLSSDDTTLGSTFDSCCDKIFCGNYTCTTDYDGDGNGTQWYKRMDTNAFKWQGSTDEECCHPKYCSQYTTANPSKWRRKTQGAQAILGSTDRECYDPIMCDKFCGCKAGQVLRPDADNTQGSTVAECCESVQATTTAAR
eukprot:TRINITY_DN5843_c0_g1_i1.p1 TRINITY_DN5843_c0_g1~~TRINITY_DN5843_c0_g1_i1.p1  ORF type:complete len:598 (+),score=87.82 TRINITY_DN5843_c0_g1_i1:63-1856(+)